MASRSFAERLRYPLWWGLSVQMVLTCAAAGLFVGLSIPAVFFVGLVLGAVGSLFALYAVPAWRDSNYGTPKSSAIRSALIGSGYFGIAVIYRIVR